MPYTVLALDLATTTGWALHSQGMQRPHFGAFRLPGKPRELGVRIEAVRAFLAEKEQLYGPITDFVFEAQHVAEKMNMDTVYMLIALGGFVEWFAYKRQLQTSIDRRVFKIHISEWRKHFIGRGGGFKRDKVTKHYLPGQDPKELAIAACARLGWHTDVADAAEGAGILDYYLHLLAKGDRRVVIPWREQTLLGGIVA